MNTFESYPPATGDPANLGFAAAPASIVLSGSGVSKFAPSGEQGTQGGNVYTVTLSSPAVGSPNNPTTVTLDFALYNGEFPSVALHSSPKTFTAVSLNAESTTALGTQESYPAPKATVGEIATVGSVTNNADGTGSVVVSAQNQGQAVIEIQYPAFGNGDQNYVGAGSGSPSLPMQNNSVAAQLIVNVVNQ
jgi:hypothetical protein